MAPRSPSPCSSRRTLAVRNLSLFASQPVLMPSPDNWLVETLAPAAPTSKPADVLQAAIATDGSFLYLLSKDQGLLKIGSGVGGTVRAHQYARRADVTSLDAPSLIYAAGRLWVFGVRAAGKVSLIGLNANSLAEEQVLTLQTDCPDPKAVRVVTDGRRVFVITQKDPRRPASAAPAEASSAPAQNAEPRVLDAQRVIEDLQQLGRILGIGSDASSVPDEGQDEEESGGSDDEQEEEEEESQSGSDSGSESAPPPPPPVGGDVGSDAQRALEQRMLERYREALSRELTQSQQIEASHQAKLVLSDSAAKYFVDIYDLCVPLLPASADYLISLVLVLIPPLP